MKSAWTPSKDDYAEVLVDHPSYRLEQLWQGLYGQANPLEEISNLPNSIKESLGTDFGNSLTEAAKQESANGETIKWLWTLPDGAEIETVLMHYDNRSTVCISSQSGCAMACGFCATGQMGYERHLSVGEICEQVAVAKRTAEQAGRRLSNVVFMGMGEPLANYKNVVAAVERINADFGIGARHIVVSTVGLVPQIYKLAEVDIQFGLAISLHAANDEKRTELVPINNRHPIAELVAAGKNFFEVTGRRVSIEWAMMDGQNDSPTDANELASIANDMKAHVNLIPLNPTPGWPTVGSSTETIKAFVAVLEANGVNVTVRRNRGTDIDAACGQLRSQKVEFKK